MIETLFDLPPNAAIPWVKKFLAEEWSTSGILKFVRFCEEDYQNRLSIFAERGVPDGSMERIKASQILYHLRDQVWYRNQKLLALGLV